MQRLAAALLAATVATAAPAQTAWPDPDLPRALLTEQGLLDAYDALRARLGQVGELYRASGTLRTTAAMLADPLAAPPAAVAITDRLDAAARADAVDLHALFTECARLADLEPPPADLGPDLAGSPTSEAFEDRLDLAVARLDAAARELDVAFAALPAGERHAAAEAARALCDRFVQTVYPTEDPGHTATVRLQQRVDRGALLRAACHLAPLCRAGFWTPLRRGARGRTGVDAPPGVDGTVLAVRETPAGLIMIGGFGDNAYDLDAALIVDLAGDDRYAARATRADPAQPLNVVVDLRGDDTYDAGDTAHLAQGAALFGVSLLADHSGDDVYRAARIAQGAGVAGVGVLIDAGGTDRYEGDAYVQGAGCFGFGILVERDGDDAFHAGLYAQGFAGPLAVGVLADAAGDDLRRATGRYPSSYGTAGEFMAMSQGAGVGMRTLSADKLHVAGGVGVLVDGGGDDRAEVGEFGFGIGYFLGLGIVRDRDGADRVDASRYGIASGAHQAVGIVLDDAGDDRYANPHTASLAGNWDHTVSILVDAAGDDVYEGAGITCGSATITSFALLADGGGDDRYDTAGSGLALGRCGHPYDVRNRTRCVALLLDLGGGRDTYPGAAGEPAPANDVLLVRRKNDTHEGATAETGVGLFVDR